MQVRHVETRSIFGQVVAVIAEGLPCYTTAQKLAVGYCSPQNVWSINFHSASFQVLVGSSYQESICHHHFLEAAQLIPPVSCLGCQ
jgi:hypothetical protein